MASETDIPTTRVAWPTASADPDWIAIYRQRLPYIYNYFRYRLGRVAEAEDLTAITFEKAWRGRHRYRRDVAAFSTWLLRIARNVATDHLRATRTHAPIEEAADTPAATTPEDEHGQASDFARLAVLVAQLPERERELLSLKYGAGVNNRTIAELMNMSESNVGTILHRTVQELRARW
jgi:RNA polymerase sigma-70 factor, ECF subfamily